MRTRRYLPKRQMEPQSQYSLDTETLEWMRTHSINDITDIAIMKVTEGENPKPAIKLMNDISEITWKAGIDTEHDSDEAPQNVMEYYADEQEMVTA